MCAALLGLILVCSTIIFPPGAFSCSPDPHQTGAVSRAVEPDVDVAVTGDFESGNAVNGPSPASSIRNLSRRLLQSRAN